jgi:hypothetical protein
MSILRRKPVVPVVIFLAIAFFSIISPAQATVVTDGCANVDVSCTLQELVSGGSIVIDDKVFDNWSVDDFSTNPVSLSDIEVMALDDQPLNPGLHFHTDNEFTVAGFDLIDLTILFGVSTLDGVARIKDNSLEINEFLFGAGNLGGFIAIYEDILDVSGDLIGEKFVSADNFPPPLFDLFDSATFSPQATISIEKTILIGGDDVGDTVSLYDFTQRFSQIPEPATLVLIGVGLTGFGFARRKMT